MNQEEGQLEAGKKQHEQSKDKTGHQLTKEIRQIIINHAEAGHHKPRRDSNQPNRGRTSQK